MRPVIAHLLALALATPLVAQVGIHPDELALKADIDNAIERGVEALINSQYRDGTWGQWGHYRGGKTALCAYALLKCGVAADHPTIQRALLFLDPIRPMETYTVGCMMLAYGAAGPERYRKRLEELTDLLIDWQRSGDYAYPTGQPDLSNTQYAALGLWTAQKHDIKIPTKVWTDLLDDVLRYAEKPTRVDVPATGTTTVSNGGTMDIAGFGYRRGQKATGSMTTAGVSILQICEIGLGSRLGGGSRREVDRAIEAGVNWLAHNFAVDKKPGKGDWAYYYLYGLERVGALTRLEQIGSHWWYVEGARHLLAKQEKSGHWPGAAQRKDVRTSFALLFLRRATSGQAAATGVAGSGAARHLFAAGTDADAVAIAGAGQQPLALWVGGFGDALKERHRQYGLRIVEVAYLDGELVLGQLAGKPTAAWHADAFLYRAAALPRGPHAVRARVQLVSPEVRPGETTPTETVFSPVMQVMIRDVFAPWMAEAAKIAEANLVVAEKVEATASTAEKTAKHACDGDEGTHWVCDATDADPVLTIELGNSVASRSLMIGQAGTRASDIGLFDRITVLEVRLNKSKPIRVELDPDQLAITAIPFGQVRKIRRIELRIVEREPGRRQGQAGFTEIALCR